MKFIVGEILFYSVVTTLSNTYHWYIPSINSFNIDIYTTADNGTYPMVIFMTGFAGLVPGSLYSTLSTKMANQKIIVIVLSQRENITAEYVEAKFTQFMINFTNPNGGVKDLFRNKPETVNVVPDIENQLVFLGHSAGCHVLTLYLTHRCGTQDAQVKAAIFADPVDGSSPYDTNDAGYVTHPPQQLSFNTSVLIISSGLGNKPLYPGQPACAQDSMSNDRFYQCLSGPKWLLNFTDFGHGDITDLAGRLLADTICTTCSCSPLLLCMCNYGQYIQDVANAVANFTTGILSGTNGQQQLQFLQDPGSYFQSRVTIKPTMQQVIASNGFCQRYS